MVTLPETNGVYAPKNGGLEHDPFLWGRLGLFSERWLLVSGDVSSHGNLPSTWRDHPGLGIYLA